MSSKEILLVEDDAMNMRLAQYILESEGYSVVKAANAREALEHLDSSLPALVLMDIQLPDMDGTTVIRILRENPRTKDIPVLVLTACAMKGDRERILQMGCDGYISKPIDVQGFIKTVRVSLAKRRNEKGACH